MTTVQQVAKELVKAGFKKATTKRENFQTVFVGNYTARHLKCFGLNCITITPANGTNINALLNSLTAYKTEIKNGIIIVK